jgi:hypothetical protein
VASATLSRVVCGRQRPGANVLSKLVAALDHPDWNDPDVLMRLWCNEYEPEEVSK